MYMVKNSIKAIAVFNQRDQKVRGTVVLTETENKIKIEVNLSGLKEGEHGFHVHEAGRQLKWRNAVILIYQSFAAFRFKSTNGL